MNNDWNRVIEGEEPEGKVLVAYDEACWGSFSKETECAYFEDGIWRFWLTDKVIITHDAGVTHWMTLPVRDNDYE